MVILCGFPIDFASKKGKSDRKPSQKAEKKAEMSNSISAKIHPFRLCQPKSQQRIERAFAAVTLGVGTFCFIAEEQLQ
jgi:hypothetical protein